MSPWAVDQRDCANGRSIETTEAETPAGSSPSRWLNFCDSSAQTLVSSDGTTTSSAAFLPSSSFSRLTIDRSPPVRWKSGAASPAFRAGPSSVIGLPLKVMAPARSCKFCVVMPPRFFNGLAQHLLEAVARARHHHFHSDTLANRDV